MQFTQSRMLPRFTEQGFDVVSTPAHIHGKLKAAVDDGVRNWDTLRTEGKRESDIIILSSSFLNVFLFCFISPAD